LFAPFLDQSIVNGSLGMPKAIKGRSSLSNSLNPSLTTGDYAISLTTSDIYPSITTVDVSSLTTSDIGSGIYLSASSLLSGVNT
jgi:hypothetical protein